MSAERIGTDDLLPEIRSARTTLEVTQLAVRVLDTQIKDEPASLRSKVLFYR